MGAASDLSRYKEWLSIHRVWRSTLPETLEKGTQLVSIVEVKGMANLIRWTIVNYKPPEAMTLNGDGEGGVKVKLIGKIKPAAQDPGRVDGDVRRAPRWSGAVRAHRDARRGCAQGRHPGVARQVQVRLRTVTAADRLAALVRDAAGIDCPFAYGRGTAARPDQLMTRPGRSS